VPQPARLVARPTWLLTRAHARAHALLAAAFATAGVRGYDYRVLAALAEFGPASQASIGQAAGMDPSDVVATLNRVIAANAVARRQDPADRRRNVVSITDQGRALLERLDDVVAAVQDEVLAPIPPEERATFLDQLARLG
jgi:DNA-binding MarR family transcriptional regulator